MKGLFLNELYMLKKSILFYSVLIVAVAAANLIPGTAFSNMFARSYCFLLSYMLVVNSFSCHKMAKWDSYANVLPVTKKQLVGVWYLLAAASCTAGFGIVMFLSFLRFLLLESPVDIRVYLGELSSLFSTFFVFCFMVCLFIPLVIKFGQGIGAGLSVLIMAVFFALGMEFIAEMRALDFLLKHDVILLILGLLFFLGTVYGSFQVSVAIYGKKEF